MRPLKGPETWLQLAFCAFCFQLSAQSEKMSLKKLFGVPVRLISRSSIRAKVSPLGTGDRKDKINLEDTVEVPVETDTQRLVDYVCGTNLLVEGGEDIKIKPDSEYPEWLWSIRSPLPMEELDKNSKTYWNKVRKIRIKEEMHLKTLKRISTVHK